MAHLHAPCFFFLHCPLRFHAWDPLGSDLPDRIIEPPLHTLPEATERLMSSYEKVRALDFNSIWSIDKDSGERKGDRLGLEWSESQASSEWLEPRAMK